MINTILIGDNVGLLPSNRYSCYANELHIVPGVWGVASSYLLCY